jgi:hypothetical protein
MSNPSVAAVMLVNGRPEMARRAVASFVNQTYDNRLLIIWDTGEEPLNIRAPKTICCRPYSDRDRSIGELRNEAIGATNADIIVTFDSDDWSHERRIEEQVALLTQYRDVEAVGFNECLFWHEERIMPVTNPDPDSGKFGIGTPVPSEAYLYSNPHPNYAIGASLAFWRSTWQRRPFPHLPIPGNRQSAGEDAEWLKGVKCAVWPCTMTSPDGCTWTMDQEPRLICSIHGGNSQMYELGLNSPYFKRAAEWDDYCRKEMKL